MIIVPLQDPAEPNNTIADAKAKASPDLALTGPGSSGTITGRISFVPDPDYYRVRLVGATAGPDAPALQGDALHRAGALPAGAGQEGPAAHRDHRGARGRAGACAAGDAGVCIISAAQANYNYPIATSLCQAQLTAAVPPVGAVRELQHPAQVPEPLQLRGGAPGSAQRGRTPTTSSSSRTTGNNWADDTDYTITVNWLGEPDAAEAVPDPQRPATMAAGRGQHSADRVPELRHRRHRHQPRHRADHRREGLRRPRRRRGHLRRRRPGRGGGRCPALLPVAHPLRDADRRAVRPGHPPRLLRAGRRRGLRQRPDPYPDRRQPAGPHLRDRGA